MDEGAAKGQIWIGKVNASAAPTFFAERRDDFIKRRCNWRIYLRSEQERIQDTLYHVNKKSRYPHSNRNGETKHPPHERDTMAFVFHPPELLVGHCLEVFSADLQERRRSSG